MPAPYSFDTLEAVRHVRLAKEAYQCATIEIGSHACLVQIDGACDDLATVAFRGTDDLRDWWTNLDASVVKKGRGNLHVHHGFWQHAALFWQPLLEFFERHEIKHVTVCGHSLGAALATVFATELLLARTSDDKIPSLDHLYTFGSPRVYASRSPLHDFTHRFVNNNDVVAHVPSNFLSPWNWDHVGQIVYFDHDDAAHEDWGPWRTLRDRIAGRIADLGKPGTDGVKDHSIDRYVELVSALHVDT